MRNQNIPFNDDAEKIVICSILIDNDLLPKIKDTLTPQEFFSPRHRAIYQAMLSLDGAPIDPVTLRGEMQNLETGEDGCQAYIEELLGVTSTSAGARHHVGLIKEAAIKRALIDGLRDVVKEQAQLPAADFVGQVREQLDRIDSGLVGRDRVSKGAPTMADVRQFLDLNITAGTTFTAEKVCRGLGAFSREHRKHIYVYLSRLVRTILKREKWKHGGFRKVVKAEAYFIDGDEQGPRLFPIKLPLDMENVLTVEEEQIVEISGRYDAGKSAYLFHTMALNYQRRKIVHFSSAEWTVGAIKARLDELGIPRPHPNITCYPMSDGYEDSIPAEPCIVLVDYIRTQDSPYEIDRAFHRIFENLHGGVAVCAIQKHVGIDRPTGGQFATAAPQHFILLDKGKGGHIVKILKSKIERNIEGLWRGFRFEHGRRLFSERDWKMGEIVWEKASDSNQNGARKGKSKGF